MRAELAAPMPDGLRFDAAAALPVAFLTADIGLNRIAGMQRGDRVLIHAATGGVGLAALALAQRAGAEIFATAGSAEKRAYLRHLGVAHVFDSRSLDFADGVLAATGGEGVRIALNSLAGPFIGETLRVLAPGGVLLELGKRDIWTPQQVASSRPDVSYHPFDAGTMAEADPSLFQQMAKHILPAIARGEIAPLPVDIRPLDSAREALRHMAQARHIGKIVLAADPGPASAPEIRADGSYLITGGLGGIGLKAAEWLVAKGARHITLVGRSAPGEAASQVIAELERAGARLRIAPFDISDLAQMRTLLAEMASAAPLRGIVHTAGIAADGLVRSLNAAALREARRGKVAGAQALRQLTRGMPLDFVILCSSAAGLFGAEGQGAYAAANAELEALATQWRREGAPVVSMAWVPWAESGMFAAASSQARQDWHERGLIPMSSRQAFAALDRVLASGQPHAVTALVDWPKVSAYGTVAKHGSLFADVGGGEEAKARSAPTPDGDLARLRALPGSLQRGALMEALARRVRAVLDLPEDAPIPPAAPLKLLGLDSLMAVELRNQLARFGGMALPATLAFDHPTLEALADRLSLAWGLRPIPPSQAPESSEETEIDVMGDAEAEAMLVAELAALAAEPAHGRRLG